MVLLGDNPPEADGLLAFLVILLIGVNSYGERKIENYSKIILLLQQLFAGVCHGP